MATSKIYHAFGSCKRADSKRSTQNWLPTSGSLSTTMYKTKLALKINVKQAYISE